MGKFREFISEDTKQAKDFTKLIRKPIDFLEDLQDDISKYLEDVEDDSRRKKVLEKQQDVVQNALDHLSKAEDTALFVLKNINV